MNSLRLCGGSAVTTATLAMKRTFMWHNLRAAADDADRLLTGGWIPISGGFTSLGESSTGRVVRPLDDLRCLAVQVDAHAPGLSLVNVSKIGIAHLDAGASVSTRSAP